MVIAFICWQIWKVRSEIVVGKKGIDRNKVIFRIKGVINE